MELRQLNTFCTVATTLNFTRAAEVQNYVPSNVTMQIKALEEELDVRLFDRLGKQLVLSAAGKRFLIHARSVLDKLDEASSVVHDNEALSGTLTISANEDYRTMFDWSFEKEGIDSITYLEFQSAEAIKQCAISGIGIAFLPEIVTKAEAERGELVALPWQIPDLHVYTQMLWHKDKWLSPILLSFIRSGYRSSDFPPVD